MKKITRQQLIDELIQANELCRSMYQIVNRKGVETNWLAFKAHLEKALDSQHDLIYATNLH